MDQVGSTENTYIGLEDIRGVFDVGDIVAQLLDRVDQAPYVACTIVKEIRSGHIVIRL